uniref:IstB-like ATP binding protein n=1 Tax=Candidatus Kentrum sp. MB TaxID=2138164 RepID=A0A450XUL3_9GAMM|nr:MAG: IstB-like ATP binding protein [Candidatus Kentron sp. MB]VFK75823.1 MAG: IstB-like ATP binding protein [Candidatus Kentron sp. MB]
MKLIDARHGLRFMLIASQLPIDSWHEYIGEATLADVILRLIHNAHLLNPCAGYHQKPYLILRIQIRKKGRRKKRKNFDHRDRFRTTGDCSKSLANGFRYACTVEAQA